ncbi:10899_t:CDS:2, partial [Entrophospora sp. SA101]
ENDLEAEAVELKKILEKKMFNNAFEGVYGLYDMGAIKSDKAQLLSSEQLEKNITELKRKLGKDTLPLYQCLYSDINRILVRELTRKDPLASQVIRDNSGLIRGIPKTIRLMKLAPISEVENICRGLEEVTLKFLGTLKQVWQNPAFRPEFLATVLIFERQSLASADRRGNGKVGRRPDIMFVSKEDDKFYELMYTESSTVICTKQKEEEDDIKLWGECRLENDNLALSSDDIYLKIYATGTLSNDEIVYTTSRFHGK